MKGKEDERERATEKHIFFLRIEQESDQNGRIPKNKGRKTRMKKKKKMEKQKKRKTLGKNINNHIFFKNQMVSKKEEIQNLNAKQV